MKNTKKDNIKILKRIFKELFFNYWMLIIIIVSFIITAYLATISPRMVGDTMTEIYNQFVKKVTSTGVMDFAPINLLLKYLIIIYCSHAIFDYIKNVLVINASQKYVANLRKKVDLKILNLPVEYFDKKNNGEILSLLINDIENINLHLPRVTREVFTEVLNIIGACIMMYLISPKLILINIFILIISGIIIFTLSRISLKFFVKKQEKISNINSVLEENYTGRATIQIFNKTDFIKEKFNVENKELSDIAIKSGFISSIAGSVLKLLENVTIAIIAIVSAVLKIKGQIEIGYIYTIISYTKTMTNPLGKIGDSIRDFLDIIASAKRVYTFIDEKEFQKNKVVKPVGKFEKSLIANSICFGYESEKTIIKDMNIEIFKGNKIAIVGRTGSGKTTLIKLLMNIYTVDKGKIEFDGINVNEINSDEYLKNFSIITQDINLFTDTIMENIKYGNPEITDDEVIEIAKQIGINDMILQLENGYNTYINENDNISSGMKQLIVLMQNIVSKAPILVFDEATNMLDEKIKQKIEEVMNYIRKQKTLIVIAHNLNIIKDSDCIYVVDDGRIVEKGTHEQLLNNKNIYEKMYNI